MKLRIHVSLIAAAVLLISPPSGRAQFDQQKLIEAQKKQAAQKAAIAKRRAAVAAGNPAAAAGAPAPGVRAVYVSVTNNTRATFRALVAGPDGSPREVGQIPPSAQSGGPTVLESLPGQQWGFANQEGQIVANYVSTAAAQQRYNLGPTASPQGQQPATNQPSAGAVRLTVENRWGGPVTASRFDANGSIANFEVGAKGTTLTSAPGARWVFNANGRTIREVTLGPQSKQSIVLSSPQELLAAQQQDDNRQVAAQQASAAKQQRQRAFLARLNDARLQAGVPPLAWSQKLAEKAAQTYNPLGGGYSMAVAYHPGGGGPQSPVDALEYWFAEQWGKAQLLLDGRVKSVGYWEDPKRGVGFEYAPNQRNP